MSVRKGDRSEGKLGVLDDIVKLAAYTIQVCKSEKVFPKSSRWIMAKPIVDECVAALTCVRRANAVLVETVDDFEYRHGQQMHAHGHLEAMLSLIDLAYASFKIEASRIEYWTGLVLQADDKLKGWAKADAARYMKQLNIIG